MVLSQLEVPQPAGYRTPKDPTMGGKFRFDRISPFIWTRPSDGCQYIGTELNEFGGFQPTYQEKISEGRSSIDTAKGIANGDITDAEKIFDHFKGEWYEKQRVYMTAYLPRYQRGESVDDITADLKAHGFAGGGTLTGETFNDLRATQIQIAGVRISRAREHVLLQLVEVINVDKLHPVGYMDFATQNAIHKMLGEFEIPYQGTAGATTHSWSIDRYGAKFSIGEEFYLYDYPNVRIIDAMMDDIGGQLQLAKNEEVFEKMTSADVTTQAVVGGSWSLYASNLSTHNPDATIDVVYNALDALDGTIEYAVSNRNHYRARELNTYIKGQIQPQPNVNPGRGLLDIPRNNGAHAATGLEFPWYIDNMFADADGIVLGQRDAIKFANGPSFTRTYEDSQVGVRGVINKWFFGGYVFDGLLVRRITGAA